MDFDDWADLFPKTKAIPALISDRRRESSNGADAARDSHPFAEAIKRDELRKMAATNENTHNRNDTLNTAWLTVYRLVLAGELDDTTARAEFVQVSRHAGLPDHEIRATMRSAEQAARYKYGPRRVPERELVAVEPAFVIDEQGNLVEGPTGILYVEAELVSTPVVDRPRVWRAADLEPAKPQTWLAKNRLPEAAVTVLYGEEGIGKSLSWVLIAAAVTTGRALPDFGIPAREPGHVFIVVTEDDWSSVVLPRLKVADADLTYIRVICTDRDGSGAPVFPRDLDVIRGAEVKPVLVVVDAWLDTLPPSLVVRDPQQARQALHPWKEVATTTGGAVLLVAHTNRLDSGSARDRIGATGVLRQKARMTLVAVRDESGCLLIGPEKSNGAAIPPATRFRIEAVQYFDASDDHDGSVPKLVSVGLSDQTAGEHFAAAHQAAQGPTGGDAKTWLRDYLSDGPKLATDVHAAAQNEGFSEYKVRAAKKSLNVKARHAGGSGTWSWQLPDQDAEQDAVDHISTSCFLDADPDQWHEPRYQLLDAKDGAFRGQDEQDVDLRGTASCSTSCSGPADEQDVDSPSCPSSAATDAVRLNPDEIDSLDVSSCTPANKLAR